MGQGGISSVCHERCLPILRGEAHSSEDSLHEIPIHELVPQVSVLPPACRKMVLISRLIFPATPLKMATGFGKVAEPLPRRAGSRSRSQDNSRGAGCQPRQPQPTEQQPPQKQQPQQQQQQQEQQQQQQETQQQQQQQQQTPQKQQQSSATRVQQQEGEQPQKQDEQEQQLQQQVQQIQHAAESAFPIAHSEQPEGTGRLVASADSGPVSSCSVADDKVAPLEQMTSLIANGPAEQGAAESFKPLDLLVDDLY
ncbi:unnamed protein product [Polarella glacialis]|uniref:Uncharacterized protein n=1 Tax=Polarella glacialis TaxID=89957 RepID=A0A813JWP4_POLGL|nr:unnamed protein product [Polarella glacialis]